MAEAPDAVVVGSGPNGLAAAIELARSGLSVTVYEAAPTAGGGTRSAELTLPGFVHDVCSAIHPLTLASPFMRTLKLEDHGLELIQPDAPLAHPLDDGSAVVVERSVAATAERLGPDGGAWQKLFDPLVARAQGLEYDLLGPQRIPRHPLQMAAFGLRAIRSASGLARSRFRTAPARAVFGGIAAHSSLPLDSAMTGGVGLVLGMYAHAVGWPMAKGGSQAIADAMASVLRSLGGAVVTGQKVGSLAELPASRVVMFDVTPRQVLSIAGDALPGRYRRALDRFRYGPASFKVDWALDGPVPWKSPDVARAATVHVVGTLEQAMESEAAPSAGRHADRPYVLLAQQSLFDSTRAPAGKHTLWGYCHVPNGSDVDMTERIEAQIERFAPGFRDLVAARAVTGPAGMEAYNANYVGGDINGGAQNLRQHLARPVARMVPYATPSPRLYICSSSTPPGGGVHGMCGYWAAKAALNRTFKRR
ncbi:MAG TPA: NAD(P)/FAD-dependent oxidoreductase [Actinomycetota bacterium]|nr:NAD(P)/FAD-dependent oxidoreductase [Actinomycetota bacterium]